MSFWIGGAKGEEAQVDGAFVRNISNHSDLANGSARNDVGEPGKRVGTPGMYTASSDWKPGSVSNATFFRLG